MRWDHLFDDLSAQLEHELRTEQADLEQEEERLRLGRLPLRERLVALRRSAEAEQVLTIRLVTGERVRLRLVTIGRDWFAGSVEAPPRAVQMAVPLAAVDALLLSPAQATTSLIPVAEASELGARLGLSFLLRDLCRRRASVALRTRGGQVTGTIDRVGRDHLDLAEHDRDEPRRATAVEAVRVIPLDQLVSVTL
ncbi:hypothetical protein [Microcella frigidaquae]|uniref:Uncharacterized protein n=1 Tax=Microcella frigidaquae TaxID=424758 RepID=A0A840XC05_9MICO|nr:hypothetical protein [Microcella frigidaquae]MBB5618565.1 hypothetical protein [Microcella frigidaquae]NHN44001.1 hypothetical protein [Microcella frigidaquae]